MLHLVSEQFDSPVEQVERMEYEHWGAERMAQLEQEDLERYERSKLKNSSYSYNVTMEVEEHSQLQTEFNKEMFEFMDAVCRSKQETRTQFHNIQCQMNNTIDMLRELLRSKGLDVPPSDQLNFNPAATDDFDSSSKTQSSETTAAIHGALKVSEVVDSQEMPPLEDDVSGESTIEDSVIADNGWLIEIPDSNGVISFEATFKHSIDEENKQNEDSDCVILGKMDDQYDACKVFAEMPEPFLTENLLDIEVAKADHYLLIKRLTLSLVNSDEGLCGKKDYLSSSPYIIETRSSDNGSSWVNSQNLSYEDAVVLRVSSSNVPPLSKQGLYPQVFDPGTVALFKQEECEGQWSENEGQLHFVCPVLFQFVSNHRNEYIDKFARNLFGNMSKQYSSKQEVSVKGLGQSTSGNWELYMINFTGDLCFKDDDINIAPAINSSKIMFGETSVFMFAPSIGSLHLTGSAPLNSCEMPGSFAVALWLPKAAFYFNPDACCLFYNDCDDYEFNIDLHADLEVNGAIFEVITEVYLAITSSNLGVEVFSVVVLPLKFDSAFFHVQANGNFAISLCEIFGKAGLSPRHVSSFVSCKHIRNTLLCVASNFSNRDVPIQVFIGEKVMFVVKIISCLTLFSYGWAHSLDLAGSYGTWPCWLSPLKANFVYDPGICSISIYILEDKDGFKRVEKRIVLVEHILELTVTMPMLMNCGEDHFGAITLKQTRDMAYAFARSFQLGFSTEDSETIKEESILSLSLQTLYPKYGWVRTSIVLPSWCTLESEVAEYMTFEVKGSVHHLLNGYMYAIQVFDPDGSYGFQMIRCSLETNDSKRHFDFGLREHNACSFGVVFRLKVCPNVAILLGLVSSIVTQLPQYMVLISYAGIGFNANKHVWTKFMATILLSVEVLNKMLGDRLLIHPVALVDGGYNIQIFIVGKMVKSGSNICNSVLSLNSAVNAVKFGEYSTWNDCFMRVPGCISHSTEPVHNIETFSGSVETIMSNGVDLNFQTKQSWNTGCLDETTWNPLPAFQMSMKDVLIEHLMSTEHLRLSYDVAKDGYLQQKGQYGERLAEVHLRDTHGASHEVDARLNPDALTFFTTKLQYFIWNPGIVDLKRGTFMHIKLNFRLQDEAADEIEASLTNGIDTHMEMMDQGQYIDGALHGVREGTGVTPNALAFSTIELEHYIWDPGLWNIKPFGLCYSFDKRNVKENVVWHPGVCHFTTLRTRGGPTCT